MVIIKVLHLVVNPLAIRIEKHSRFSLMKKADRIIIRPHGFFFAFFCLSAYLSTYSYMVVYLTYIVLGQWTKRLCLCSYWRVKRIVPHDSSDRIWMYCLCSASGLNIFLPFAFGLPTLSIQHIHILFTTNISIPLKCNYCKCIAATFGILCTSTIGFQLKWFFEGHVQSQWNIVRHKSDFPSFGFRLLSLISSFFLLDRSFSLSLISLSFLYRSHARSPISDMNVMRYLGLNLRSIYMNDMHFSFTGPTGLWKCSKRNHFSKFSFGLNLFLSETQNSLVDDAFSIAKQHHLNKT